MNPPSLFAFKETAEAGGFEPPVRLPVRQFSKLLVSATHPNFHTIEVLTEALFLNCGCKGNAIFSFHQIFCRYFSVVFLFCPFLKPQAVVGYAFMSVSKRLL